MTPAQAKRQRAELLRAVKVEEKRKDRARLVALRGRARALRKAQAAAIVEARRTCAARRRAVPTLREAAAMLRAARAEARATCDAGLAKARKMKSEAARAKAEREAEAAHQRAMRLIERHAKERETGRGPRLAKARVRREESDDEVRHNIPPELAFLFERVKRQIKGSARRTRTEEFLEYAETHPDEELAALEDKTDALIRELEARERRANGRNRRKPSARRWPRSGASAPRSDDSRRRGRRTKADARMTCWKRRLFSAACAKPLPSSQRYAAVRQSAPPARRVVGRLHRARDGRGEGERHTHSRAARGVRRGVVEDGAAPA